MKYVLSHAIIDSEQASQTALLVHGALGSGQNFRSFAKRLQLLRPDYRLVLVDLRAHGGSSDAPAPHSFAIAAQDLAVLIEHLGTALPVSTVIGHSLGGKLTLELFRQLPELGVGVASLRQGWILDSNPGAQPPHAGLEILRVLSAVKSVQMPASSRALVVEQLRAQGMSSGISNWMTTNLKRSGDEFEWVFNIGAIEQLVESYFAWDLWPYLEQARTGPELQFVVADQSDRLDAGMRQRLQSLPVAARCHVQVLPNSGHWVHVDNPDGLLEMMRRELYPALSVAPFAVNP